MARTRQEDAGFDFVIIGAGSAGCVLANRLSADLSARVALIEAGGKDDWIWFHIPAGYLFAIGNPRADWMFRTEPDPGLNGRSLAYPRGRVIGGSSAINAMIYMRGQAADYDHWRQTGLAGWGWNDVLPFFRKSENHFGGESEFHGAGGEWHVNEPRIHWELLDVFRDAARETGIPLTDDFNRGDNEGCGYFHVNQRNGRRLSAAHAFLKPALKRPNLTLITRAMVDRIVFEGRRATGIRIRWNGTEETLFARREIILSAGAVASPTILERSGIGDGARLQLLGIPVVHHSPGVGENLQDHLQLRLIFKVKGARTMNVDYRSLIKRARMALDYALRRRGPLAMAPSQLGAFIRSSPDYATPNLQFHIQPLSLDKFGEPMHDFPAFTASVANLRPTSRGSVHARSREPDDPPIIVTNYLSTPEDRRVAAESIRLTRRIVAARALARFEPVEYRPGAELQSEAELLKAAGDVGTTIFHPVGTAKMGTDSDPLAVVDAKLQVRGAEGLRVVDASVMPVITSGNTAAPTMMIAEKAAAIIRKKV
ncbi:MAG TPA: GMC family oxidoreductase N-terminal domain-containing protein [Micropepsaceae bacterium]|jgi:choline dehydrogenase-like flavoprotein|nr:GMC family oxidoreductase N-terminal domain-containing protein [Micropepsaceae bacterium]